MESLEVNNFGPIEKAKVNFGDLTFVVGPQASGKSLFLELLTRISSCPTSKDTITWSRITIPRKFLIFSSGKG